MYPPGQFSVWNRASVRAAWLGVTGPREADAEPAYSALAVSDPSADATATQTWAVIDDDQLSAGSAPARTGRDWGSHTGQTLPNRQRQPGDPGRLADAGRPGSLGREPRGAALSARTTEPARRESAIPREPVIPREPATPRKPATPREPPIPREPAIPRDDPRRASTPITREVPQDPGEAEGGRRSRAATTRPASRRAGRSGKRRHMMMTGLLLAPVIVVVLVVVGYVFFLAKPGPTSGHTAAPRRPTAAPTASPTLGPWKHIESRAQDPAALTITELFPAKFSALGATGVRTVDKASTNCSREVFGSALATAVRKADCTQVLRASYLSTDHKYMATVGVLNLTDATAAQHVGKVSGSTEFIKQLPATRGPTRRLSQGTGIEEAEVKGHYLILIWTEFANLHAPSSKAQRRQLVAFSNGLIAGTANVSLSRRMLTGRP